MAQSARGQDDEGNQGTFRLPDCRLFERPEVATKREDRHLKPMARISSLSVVMLALCGSCQARSQGAIGSTLNAHKAAASALALTSKVNGDPADADSELREFVTCSKKVDELNRGNVFSGQVSDEQKAAYKKGLQAIVDGRIEEAGTLLEEIEVPGNGRPAKAAFWLAILHARQDSILQGLEFAGDAMRSIDQLTPEQQAVLSAVYLYLRFHAFLEYNMGPDFFGIGDVVDRDLEARAARKERIPHSKKLIACLALVTDTENACATEGLFNVPPRSSGSPRSLVEPTYTRSDCEDWIHGIDPVLPDIEVDLTDELN